jgi:hypothetical protein
VAGGGQRTRRGANGAWMRSVGAIEVSTGGLRGEVVDLL